VDGFRVERGGSDGTVDGKLNAPPEPPDSPYTPETGMEVGVNESVDRAHLDLLDGGSSVLEDAIASAYRVSAKPVASVHTVRDEREPRSDPPGDGWTLGRERTFTRVSVENATASPPGTQRGWHLLWSRSRRVVRTHTGVRRWQREDRQRDDVTADRNRPESAGNPHPDTSAQPTQPTNRTVETAE
jgi:hypothetical protein